MTDYQKQAKDFLVSCKATMEIKYVGLEKPNWDKEPHRTYDCTIKTPRGEMMVHFYDSLANTEIWTMTDREWYEKKFRKYYDGLTYQEKIRFLRDFKAKRNEAIPTEYDILACLTKYDVGSMDDFKDEFGYEIKCAKDITDFIDTYNAVVKEYRDICRCFTQKQIKRNLLIRSDYMFFPSKAVVENLRKEFPEGTRVELVCMNDPYTKLQPVVKESSSL